MAKLTQDNIQAANKAKVSVIDNWNPPTALTPASNAKTQMLPPQSRPLPKVPSTPSHNAPVSSLGSGDQNPSSKKKRRRRGGRRNGDSASEVATSISEDVAQPGTLSVHTQSEILVEASQPKVPSLPPDASAEEQRVYENEPEMYGSYVLSDEESVGGERQQRTTILPRRQRVQTYSPSVVDAIMPSSPIRPMNFDSGETLQPAAGHLQIPDDTSSVPAPQKAANGRFQCPFATEWKCPQTFASAKSAKRHGDQHVNADRFQCGECNKAFSRKDLYLRHLDLHSRQQTASRTRKKSIDKQGTHASPRADAGNVESKALSPIPAQESSDKILDDDEHNRDSRIAANYPSPGMTKDRPNVEMSDRSQMRNQREKLRVPASIEPLGTDSEVSNHKHSMEQLARPIKTRPRTRNKLKHRLDSPEDNDESAVRSSTKRVRRVPTSGHEIPTENLEDLQSSSVSDVEQSGEPPVSGISNVALELELMDEVVDASTADTKGQHAVDSDVETNEDRSAEKAFSGGIPTQRVQISGAHTDPNDLKGANTASGAAARMYEAETDSTDGGEHENESAGESQDDQNQVEHAIAKTLETSAKFSANPTSMSTQRQSSMNDFVRRSVSASGSTKASASSRGASVSTATHRQKLQTKLMAISDDEMDNSLQDSSSSADTAEDESGRRSSKVNANTKGKSKAVGKGKGKRKDISINIPVIKSVEPIGYEDRPRATSIARRTPSTGQKPARKPKSKTVPQKRKKPMSDDEVPRQAGIIKSKNQSTKSKRKQTKVAASESDSEVDRPVRKSGASLADARWAEASKSGLTGRFTEEENHILFSWRDSFCNENGMSSHEFNEMMTNCATVRLDQWHYNWITKSEFMQQFYNQLPERNRRSMIRFRERHFQNVEKTPWTDADDKELTQLVTELGPKWVEIAQMMGRTQDAVNQRWRHKLNYGERPALMGDWTPEEIARLEQEVSAFANLKNTTPDDEDLQIPWLAISKKLGTGRTAQQCSNRWRISTTKRVEGKFVRIPHSDRIPSAKVKKPRTPSKMEKRLSGGARKSVKQYKSAERVEDSDSDGNEAVEEGEVPQQSSDGESSDNGADNDQQNSHQNVDAEESGNVTDDTNTTKDSAGSSSSAENAPSARNSSHRMASSFQVNAGHSSQMLPLNSPHSSPAATPTVSRNPLKKFNTDQITPGIGPSLTQLHAGTQANSSAKRTTGRTTRTRVPDSVIAEDRPSPGIGVRRRPIRSSSPLMTMLPDGLGDGQQDEESESDMEMELDVKSPGTFVSASSRKSAQRSTPSVSDDETDDDSTSSSEDVSDSESNSSSDANSEAESDNTRVKAEVASAEPGSSGWTAVNLWSKVPSFLRGDAKGGPQSQRDSSDRRKTRSLADDLERRAAGIEDTDSGDD